MRNVPDNYKPSAPLRREETCCLWACVSMSLLTVTFAAANMGTDTCIECKHVTLKQKLQYYSNSWLQIAKAGVILKIIVSKKFTFTFVKVCRFQNWPLFYWRCDFKKADGIFKKK